MTKRINDYIDWEEIINQVVTELRSIDRTFANRIEIAERLIIRLQRQQAEDDPEFYLLWSLRIKRIQMYRSALKDLLDEQVWMCPI